MGWRLAASAPRGRDARCRPPVRIVSTMDAGRGDTAPHPRDQSRKARWLLELKVASTMSVNNKRVFYVKYLAHEIYADILRARPDVRLDRLENESPEEISAPILSAAHAYQIGAARDELARHFHVDQDLLRRAPNLLIVSSNGAGYDPVDVEACTEAGVLVVNQSGGNAHSVAEHALGMLLTLSKRILEADRALRREANVNRNALIGSEAQGKTIGIVGIGNVGRRIAEFCKGLLGMKVLAYDPYLSTTEMAERGGAKVELAELLRR